MKRWRNRVLACAAFGLLLSPVASRAADMTAEQTALLFDLLSPLSGGQRPPGRPDSAVLGQALTALKDEGLAGQGGRPNFQEQGILENYGNAMFLGSRAKEFTPDIGRIRDIVSSGNRPALENALTDLWVKAGRTKPDSKALEPVIQSLYGAKGQEPEETVRHVFDKPGHRIEIIHARAGGLMQVDVTQKDSGGKEIARTSVQGLTETVPAPAPGGEQDLQRRIKLEKVCTSTKKTDKDTVDELNGEWQGTGGKTWNVSHSGNKVTLIEQRPGSPPLTYTGTYNLGKISATHPITAITDMGDELPADVRAQLVGMNISFRIALELCADDVETLRGTWSSQHVTYDGMFHQVEKIHDPYDLQLTLTRAAAPKEEKIAEGAADNLIP